MELTTQLKEELAAERARGDALELELTRAHACAESKMDDFAELLHQVLTEYIEVSPISNPALGHLEDHNEARCWLYDAHCPNAPELDDFANRMKYCFSCQAFNKVAPDPQSRVGELVNSLLFLLNRRQDQVHSAQQQLVQAERLAGLGEMAAGLAHEINTPVGIILSRLDCIRMEQADNMNETLTTDLEVISKHAQRLRRITSSLTSFARRHKIDKRPVVLQELLHELLEITGRMVHKGNVVVNTDLPDVPMTVFGDGTLIQQVFMNLIINARDAMPDGGHLNITGVIEEGHCILNFQDSGVGMPETILDKVFDPFFSTKEERGTGLGLSVSYGIIKDHGGRITVTSLEGTGSNFKISLPQHELQQGVAVA